MVLAGLREAAEVVPGEEEKSEGAAGAGRLATGRLAMGRFPAVD